MDILQQQYRDVMTTEDDFAKNDNCLSYEDDEDYSFPLITLPATKSSAPPLQAHYSISSISQSSSHPIPIHPSLRSLSFNPTYDQLWDSPLLGPPHPYRSTPSSCDGRGFVEAASVSPFMFDQQFYTFQVLGYAEDPAASLGNNIIGDLQSMDANNGAYAYHLKRGKRKAGAQPKGRDKEEEEEKEETRDPSSASWLRKNKKSPWFVVAEEEGGERELTEEQQKYAEEHAEKKLWKKRKTGSTISPVVQQQVQSKLEEEEERSSFHGEKEEEGTWFVPPKYIKKSSSNYIPKRCVRTWQGHTQAVSAIRFFPNYGHLILSASMDTTLKIWDVHEHGRCMRTYMGHSIGVRDMCFANDGSQFLSASFDKNIKLWDTETGKAISTFTTKKVPYVVKLHPDDDKQHVLLAGMRDNKVVQWDTRTGEITQKYEEHRGSVNTITFIDENRRFVTTSDDLSMLVWEFGIPVVIKHIREPHMHSMPSMAMHPEGKWMAAQSMDNQIVVYSAGDKVRLNGKKRFGGHTTGGYACQLNFSPDGRFLMSGDADGRCWFWEWQSRRIHSTLRCHHGVCNGCEWHPLLPTHVATCGADGLIKFWT